MYRVAADIPVSVPALADQVNFEIFDRIRPEASNIHLYLKNMVPVVQKAIALKKMAKNFKLKT
jgi:hypothetical protein